MPILHLDPTAVRQTGQKLSTINDNMLGEAEKLRTQLTLLQMGWTGNSSNQFQEEMGILIARLRRLAEEAHDLNRRVQRKVDAWEDAARYF